MKQRHPPVLAPSNIKSESAAKLAKVPPVPLDERALKEVAGGLKAVVRSTPNGTW